MFVYCEVLCVVEFSCDGLITRPEESYRLWCFVVCDLQTSWMRGPWPTEGGGGGGLSRQKTNKRLLLYVLPRLTLRYSTFCRQVIYVLYVCGSQKQSAIISIRSTGWLVSVSMTECVHCAVRSESLNRIQSNRSFKVLPTQTPHIISATLNGCVQEAAY